ncbi:unnamed protein product [Triticum turgidum subsp. durum]|uniref:NB-ARC domain-containing protein n=1 Tax=Triticum turgidum subsp. durum TaxID=4567 RepID=A0A9R0XUB0_TRITD|nr:unnamed protein product [Triticum turgidum subsp. durum]
MKELRSKVEDISQRNVRYHLIKESSGQPLSTTATISSEVILHVAEAKTRAALHLEEEKVDLAELIARDDLGPAIAVWGASTDVGVTSIIRAAYDNKQVKDKFQCRAWVRLMHPFNPNDLFVSLVRQFYQDSCEESGKASMQGGGTATGLTVLKKMAAPDHSLVDEFNRYVTEKRYLVVIADVSTIEEWDWIKTYFPRLNGGRIIVSTQQFEVARLCTEQPCTISGIKQIWSFDKDLYVFYHKVTTTKAKVIDFIDQDGEVISICGMGGLGKTTLVTSLYQQELSGRFQRRAWLTVPRLNHQEFYNDLLQQLCVDFHGDKEKHVTETQQGNNGNETQPKKEQKPVDILAKILLENKCLIVFDDLSSTMEWQLIRKLLPSSKDNTANRIIVTTRELNVAMCCSEKERKIYNLELLTKQDALRLFEKKLLFS